MNHSYELRVYYQDTDAGGIVYHANYLAFAERARAEFLRENGASHADMVAGHGVMFVVREARIKYLQPARLDQVIRVETRLIKIGGASVTLAQKFWRDSDSLAVLDVGLGCVRAENGRAARLPEDWAAKFKITFEEQSFGSNG